MSQMVRLTGLVVYPVKSARGIALTQSLVTSHGLTHDREWMVVDEAGRFVTQRQTPRMALIETALTDDALELRAPGLEPLTVPRFRPPGSPFEATRPVTVWRHAPAAVEPEGDSRHSPDMSTSKLNAPDEPARVLATAHRARTFRSSLPTGRAAGSGSLTLTAQ